MPRKKIAKEEPAMLREIREQPAVLAALIAKRLDKRGGQVRLPEFGYHHKTMKRIKRFIFLGCGSSANASLYGSYVFEEICGRNAEYEFADEFIARKAVVEPGTAVILISQSGRSKDLLVAAEIARAKGAFLIAISNTPGSPLMRLADVAIPSGAGLERAMAATKSMSAQMLVCIFLALYFADSYGVRTPRRKKLVTALAKLPELIAGVIDSEADIAKAAKQLVKKKHLVVGGRHYNFPLALEGAHKIKETAYIHAEGFAAEELRHGSEAMIDKDFGAIFLVPSDALFDENVVVLKEFKKIGATSVIISDKKTKALAVLGKALLPVAKDDELLMPFQFLVVMQFLAYYLADLKKLDVEKPRNIKKFVGN